MYDKLDLWIKVCIDNIHICREYVENMWLYSKLMQSRIIEVSNGCVTIVSGSRKVIGN